MVVVPIVAPRVVRGEGALPGPAVASLLDLTCLWQIAGIDRPDLKDTPWEPREPARLMGSDEQGDMFAEIRRGDILVHHPYDSFEASVARFVQEAADDPDVVTIEQTLYRTSGDTPMVPALIRAAERGKGTVELSPEEQQAVDGAIAGELLDLAESA